MMHRLTEGDEALKRQIGKEVYEDYLFSIIKGSKLFDEVIPEQDYHHKKSEAKTVDVMCRKGNAYLFFECKSFTPKAKICKHVGVVPLNDIERFCFTSSDMFHAIYETNAKYDCAINWLRCPAQEEYTYEPLIEFLTQIAEQVKERAKKVYGIQ